MANNIKKPLAAALGAAFLASVAGTAAADVNPFEAVKLDSGYDLVSKSDEEGKCGEGKCGESKGDDEGKCGEGKCGEATGEE